MQNAAPSNAATTRPMAANVSLKAGHRRPVPPAHESSLEPASKKRKGAREHPPPPQEEDDDDVDPRLLRHKNRELSVLSRRLKRKVASLRSELQNAERQRLQSLGAASCLRRGWDQLEEGLAKVVGESVSPDIGDATSAGSSAASSQGLIGHILKPMVRLATSSAPHYGATNALMDPKRDDLETNEDLERLRQHIILDDPALASSMTDSDDRVLESAPKDIHARVQRTTTLLINAWSRIGKLEQLAASASSASASSGNDTSSSSAPSADTAGDADSERKKLAGELLSSAESRAKVELALAKSRFLMDALNTSQEALLATRHKLEDAELQCRRLERRYTRAREQQHQEQRQDADAAAAASRDQASAATINHNNDSNNNNQNSLVTQTGAAADASAIPNAAVSNGVNGTAGAANHQQHRQMLQDAQAEKDRLTAELAAVEKLAADRLEELNAQLQERVTLHEALRLEQGRVAAALTPSVLHSSREYKDLRNALDDADYRRRLVVRDLQEERKAHELTQRHYHDARERLEELEGVTGKQWQEYSVNQQRIATSLEEQVLALQRESAEKDAMLQDVTSVRQRAVELDAQLSATRGLVDTLRAKLARPERRDAATIESLRVQIASLEAGSGSGDSEVVKALKSELAMMTGQISELETEVDQMAIVLAQKDEQHTRLLAHQQEKENQNATLMQQQMKQNTTHRAMVVEQRLLREKAETEAQLRANIQAKMALLEERVVVAETGFNMANERSISFGEQLDQAVGELETAKSNLAASNTREERLQKDNEEARQSMAQLRIRNEELAHGMKRAEEKIASLRAKLDKAKNKLITSREAAAKAISEAVDAARAEMKNRVGGGGGAGAGAAPTAVVDRGAEARHKAQEEALRCPVLRQYWKDCILIKCGHMFCRKAVEDNLAKRNRKCPSCKTPYNAPDIMTVSLYMDNE